ncbi:MAG: hypothetical protein AAB658_20990, partial [Chloroflexota bacterium]
EPPEFYAVQQGERFVQGIRSETRYDACLVQAIKVTPGLTLTFTMNFQVEPGDGHGKRGRPEGLVVGVGIDPTGGADPRAESVLWALRDLPYSQLVTASVSADVDDAVATLFVRSAAFLPGSGTTAAGGTGNLCQRICLRTQYARTYLLLPPNAPQALWERAARTATANRWTLGGSADDAGLAASLLSPPPIVKAINPEAWANPQAPQGLTAQWFATNFPPGVNFQALGENDLNP